MFAGLAVGLTTYCIWMSKILWCREASPDVIVSSQGPFHQWIFIRIQEFAELFSPKWHDRCWYMLLSYIFVLLIVTTQLAEIYSKIQFPFSLIMSEIAFVKWPTGHLFYYSASCLESKRPIMERTPNFREMKRPIYHVWSKWCTKKHIFLELNHHLLAHIWTGPRPWYPVTSGIVTCEMTVRFRFLIVCTKNATSSYRHTR